MLKVKEISRNLSVVKFIITDSPRKQSESNFNLLLDGGYMKIAASVCPEFTGDILYVWGSAEHDSEVIEVPLDFVDKFYCTIAEFNKEQGSYIKCCEHYWLTQDDCICQHIECAICNTTHPIKQMRKLIDDNTQQEYYICISHKKDVMCVCCETKHYMLVPHIKHASIEVCFACKTKRIRLEKQHNYSYKPDPLFHDINPTTKEVVVYSSNYVARSKTLKNKFWCGHEIEQQFPENRNRELLIGIMKDKLEDLIYCKSDSSIGCGTECVTHPISWEYFKQKDWDGILNPALSDWRKSGNSVGHHVHMSLDAFTRMHLFRFLKFHHTHHKWVEFISQRPLTHFCKATGGALTKALNKGRGGDKYEFLNISDKTIEWRAFASPMSIEEFKKNQEYLYAAYVWSKDKSGKLCSEDLETYIFSNTKLFPNLVDFINKEKTHNKKYHLVHEKNKELQYNNFTTEEQRVRMRERARSGVTYNCQRCDVIFNSDSEMFSVQVSVDRQETWCETCSEDYASMCDCGNMFYNTSHCDDCYSCRPTNPILAEEILSSIRPYAYEGFTPPQQVRRTTTSSSTITTSPIPRPRVRRSV